MRKREKAFSILSDPNLLNLVRCISPSSKFEFKFRLTFQSRSQISIQLEYRRFFYYKFAVIFVARTKRKKKQPFFILAENFVNELMYFVLKYLNKFHFISVSNYSTEDNDELQN